jgi:hypothetical protein
METGQSGCAYGFSLIHWTDKPNRGFTILPESAEDKAKQSTKQSQAEQSTLARCKVIAAAINNTRNTMKKETNITKQFTPNKAQTKSLIACLAAFKAVESAEETLREKIQACIDALLTRQYIREFLILQGCDEDAVTQCLCRMFIAMGLRQNKKGQGRHLDSDVAKAAKTIMAFVNKEFATSSVKERAKFLWASSRLMSKKVK